MSLVEYLYIDERRLDAYVEQIGPPITYDKVPSWTAELGLLGPKATARQDQQPRAWTKHEKVTRLLQHMNAEDLVANTRLARASRDRWDDPQQVFVHETCTATRIIVPDSAAKESVALVLWLSEYPETMCSRGTSAVSPGRNDHVAGPLCLLQDYRRPDEGMVNCYASSAYTLLESILLYTSVQLTRPLQIADFKAESSALGPGRWVAWQLARPQMAEFAREPRATLEKLGWRMGAPRRIRTLYRIREFGPEWGPTDMVRRPSTTSTFGYPIFVVAAE